MTEQAPVTYAQAGVDIDAGEALVERIKPQVKRSLRREVLGGIGGFGALVEVPLDRYRKPVLVSGTDGVGTKLRVAIDTRRHDTVGIDLVAMCVNDVVVQGAEPLFFLDYFATGKLDVEVGSRIVAGIVEGCVQAGCALVGGETAEMPACTMARTMTSPDSASASWKRTPSSTAPRREPAMWFWDCPPPVRTRTASR